MNNADADEVELVPINQCNSPIYVSETTVDFKIEEMIGSLFDPPNNLHNHANWANACENAMQFEDFQGGSYKDRTFEHPWVSEEVFPFVDGITWGKLVDFVENLK